MKGLAFSKEHWELMRDDVAGRAPEEACGLLAGLGDRALAVFAIPNMLHSTVRFRMDPRDQWRVFQELEAQGWDLVAIYHSHPQGPAGPSQTDIDEAYYPEAVTLIWSPLSGEWLCRGYLIRDGHVNEVPLFITGKE